VVQVKKDRIQDAAETPANPNVKGADAITIDKREPENTKTLAKEFGGPKGPEPTRYGDWEKGGRCSDF
jgi:succinate dehydrogenase / fumarate reductase cytochrome b subunit